MLKRIKIDCIAMTLLLIYLLSAWGTMQHVHCNAFSKAQFAANRSSVNSSSCCSNPLCSHNKKDNDNSLGESSKKCECRITIGHIAVHSFDIPTDNAIDFHFKIEVKSFDKDIYLAETEERQSNSEKLHNRYLTRGKNLRAPPSYLFA